jgi:hypothetical protein
MEKELINHFIEHNYVGLRVFNDNLIYQFENNFAKRNSGFVKAIQNLSPYVTANEFSLATVLDFLKYIYTKDIPHSERKRISIDVLVKSLHGFQWKFIQGIVPRIEQLLRMKFFVLQTAA